MKETVVNCARDGCGHPEHLHMADKGSCRLTGCLCQRYLERPAPVAENIPDERIMDHVAMLSAEGRVVVLLPRTLTRGDLPAIQIALLRSFSGMGSPIGVAYVSWGDDGEG
jgi:hypothetical protein